MQIVQTERTRVQQPCRLVDVTLSEEGFGLDDSL